MTVGVSGTGGGFKKFIARETDITDASRPIESDEAEQAQAAGLEYIELPVAYDGLSVVVNPENDWVDQLTVDELKKIWEPEAEGKVMTWSQVRAGWPDTPIQLYGPGTDSGTFDYFTGEIVGEEGASRSDFTASEDDNVLVQGVAGDKGALGYFGMAYYEENLDKVKAVPIVNPETGQAVSPSTETVSDGSYAPLSRPLFLYVNLAQADRPEIAAFIDFYLTTGAELATEVGYVPLPDEAYQLVADRWAAKTTGSMYGESSAGKSLMDLLAGQ